MTKLVIDARMIRHSGIGTYLQSLLPFIVDNYQLTLLGDMDVLKGFSWFSKVNVIPFTVSILSIQEQFYLPRLIPACDVFWSPQYNIPLLPIRAKKRLVTIHDVYHLAYFSFLTFQQKIYAYSMLNMAVKLSDSIVTVSDFSRREIELYTRPKAGSVKVIYNGVDASWFSSTLPHEAQIVIRAKYALPARYLLYVGNVKPHKNLKRLITALRNIDKDYKLVIVGKREGFVTGDHELNAMLNHDLELKGRVLFTGHVEATELASIYQMACLLVFPSLYEGFGLPPLEAMAAGCPTVVSSAASLVEVCGDASVYCDPLDVNSITFAIQRVLDDSGYAEQLIKKGFSQVEKYKWIQSADQHKKLISLLHD